MSRRLIPVLIAAISVALVGLVGIQIYWIQVAADLKSEEFRRSANEALRSTAEILEKRETIKKLRSHQTGRFLFVGSDSLSLDDKDFPDSGYTFMSSQKITKTGDDIELTASQSDGNQVSEQKTFKKIGIDDQSLDSLFTKAEPDLHAKSNPVDLPTGEPSLVDSVIKARFGKKTAFVGDIVKRLIEVNLNEPITARINMQETDSILRAELDQRGIFCPYSFGVFTDRGAQMLSDTGYKKELSQTSIKTRLYPGDIVQDENYLHLFFQQESRQLIGSMSVTLGLSILGIFLLISVFTITIVTIIRQKKLSEIKTDFINNMTHELKTPISTISIAHEALNDPDLQSSPGILRRYIGIIGEENKRLGTLVQNVLQSAVIDKGDFVLRKESLDMHELIRSAMDIIGLQVREKSGNLHEELHATNCIVMADKIHITNVLYNLLDNANKYSPAPSDITVKTQNRAGNLVISVTDKGIGISKKNQTRIFEKLYRVPTGNLHDVKGFGLGLSYVKIITEKHGGSVWVDSEPGHGSTFYIQLPNANEHE